jgi:hypothetical protein
MSRTSSIHMINVLAYTVPILILGSLLVPDLLIRLDIPLAFPPILCIVCGVPLTLLVVRSVPDGENRAYALCQLIEMSISIVYLVLLFATGRHTYSATTSKSIISLAQNIPPSWTEYRPTRNR